MASSGHCFLGALVVSLVCLSVVSLRVAEPAGGDKPLGLASEVTVDALELFG